MNYSPFEFAHSLRIGTVDFVSPDEIKVAIDIEAPESVALNAGSPRPFPRVNSYVLIPVDDAYLVGQIEWLTVERSPFPKRRGMQDFGLVDLPYPMRKISLNPLGTLRVKNQTTAGLEEYSFTRGADALPSIGAAVVLPTDRELRSIVESGKNRRVKIGTSPLAANAEVRIDPDRLFGRHLAVLGNTGSGKSCSVAGLIRWSLEQAEKDRGSAPHARFVVLDPNGEYARAFADVKSSVKARIFNVGSEEQGRPLQVPLWFWNSSEWSSFTHATARSQRPLLQQALRNRRNAVPTGQPGAGNQDLLLYLRGASSSVRQEIANQSPFAGTKDGKYWGFIEILTAIGVSLGQLLNKDESIRDIVEPIIKVINDLKDNKCKNDRGYNKPFAFGDVDELATLLSKTVTALGGDDIERMPISEDVPIPFSGNDLLTDLDFLATNSGSRQWFEFFLARIRTILGDARVSSVVGDEVKISLAEWLTAYIGGDEPGRERIVIIDLSLLQSDVLHLITSVIARMIFEALQRYRKINAAVLPTVLVMEEAHTFIKRYRDDVENYDGASVCCQVFERIAREGRKFGLGLVLSSQRPSELSQTALSQCNSFLLHRMSNDLDQKLVHSLVPDNLRGLLRELPSLPAQNAILLGWASELPLLVKMNDLPKSQQPHSDDPDFWNVWTGKDSEGGTVERPADWNPVAKEWQAGKRVDEAAKKTADEPENLPPQWASKFPKVSE